MLHKKLLKFTFDMHTKKGFFKMEKISLKELALPLIKAIDVFNYLLKSHHRRTAIISYYIGKKMELTHEQMVDLIVAASMHDIGALSVQERDMLIKEDVENPEPHCIMGYQMLSNSYIKDIAQIIKHHHIKYDNLQNIEEDIMIQSHIVHLADRVEIFINPEKFVLSQKKDVEHKIIDKKGTVFHPDVCDAFIEVSKADIFWIDIDNMTMEELFNKLHFTLFNELTKEQMMEFALVVARIVDFRSRFTASHSYTVGQLAFKIGTIMEYDTDKCIQLLIAGYFHDIGKIGIDTKLIEKPGPLNEEEFNQVKLHPYYTQQILSELSGSYWFRDIVDWAVHHHEKNDETGYPYALKGEEISLETNIIAFSDIISALTENRPYRKGMSIDEAMQLINNKIAKTLDASLFNIIVAHKKEFNEIIQKCQTESIDAYTKIV